MRRGCAWPLGLSAVLGLVVGCSGASSGAAAGITSAPVTASSGAGSSTAPSTAPPPAGTFRNPVVAADMPDPSILKVGNTFHLYTTQNDQLNVQTATSTNLVTWSIGPDALPTLGRWATPGKTWAPRSSPSADAS